MQVQTEKNKITFSCPKCTATLKVPMQLAGVSGPCPKCGGTIAAPRPKPKAQVQTPRPPIQSRQEPPVEKISEPNVSPLPVTPRISVTHGNSAQTGEKTSETVAKISTAPQAKPPRVEIEDLNVPKTPEQPPVPSEKPSFPQSFQTALTDDVDAGTESFDEIAPQPTLAPKPEPQENTEKLAPLPVIEKKVAPPTPAPVPEPPQKEKPKVAAEITTPAPKPEAKPEPKPAAPAEEPRVTLTTLPSAKSSPSPTLAAAPKPVQISVETTAPRPTEAKQAAKPTVSSPRIQRDARNAAKIAAAASTSADTNETRPISPVTKPNYLEPQPASSAAAAAAAAQAQQSPSARAQVAPETPALPRLDASLATKTEASTVQQAPKQAPTKPTGPTKINLPQLNNGQPATAQPVTAPKVEQIQIPTNPQSQEAPPHQQQSVATQAPAAAPDPTAVPAVRRQTQAQAAPIQQAPPVQQPELKPEPVQTQAPTPSDLPPLRDEAPQTQSLQEQLAEVTPPQPAPQQGPAPAMEQPPQAKPNTVRKFFPQRRRPATEDRGLGNVLMEDSAKAESAQTENGEAFDDLFGTTDSENGTKRKFGLFHAGVIGAVTLLSGLAIILVGNAFGVFGPDQTPVVNQDDEGTPAAVVDPSDKPAVERPPEREAIANPTIPSPEVATTGVASGLASNPADVPPSTVGVAAASTEPATDTRSIGTAEPSIPGENFNSLKISDGTSSAASPATTTQTPSVPSSSDTVILGAVKETPATIVTSEDDVSDTIRERIEAANKAIETNSTGVADAIKSMAPAAAAAINGVAEAAESTISTGPNTTNPAEISSDGTGAIQPRPFSADNPTGEFKQPAASAVAGPPAPAPGTFTPPSATGSKLGKSRDLVDTFLAATTWEGMVPYTFRAEEMKAAMARYYSSWPYQPLGRSALKFEQMESDPEYGGPFWMYNVTTTEDPIGFPIVVRQEKDLLKVDWGIYAEFRDQLFVKFNNGEIAGQQKFKLIIEHLSTYYGSDAEAFTNLNDYYVFRLAPPYGGKELEEVAFVAKTSPVGTKLNDLVPLNSSPLAVTVELENQAFPHGINHLVITRIVTDGWFE